MVTPSKKKKTKKKKKILKDSKRFLKILKTKQNNDFRMTFEGLQRNSLYNNNDRVATPYYNIISITEPEANVPSPMLGQLPYYIHETFGMVSLDKRG